MRPTPGSYRGPLVAGLRVLNQTQWAGVVERGDIKLATRAAAIGPVAFRYDLCPLFIEALKASGGDPEIVAHYIQNLETGVAVPAMTAGVMVTTTPEEAALAREIAARSGQQHYAPGELFFKS